MKKYEPKELVAISRYQNFFPTLDETIQNDVYDNMKKGGNYPPVYFFLADFLTSS